MAKSQASTTKKENEKKRLQKRKEKEQRKAERKENSDRGKPLEEMLAYVDENGNISSTPPDPTKKKNIDTNEILIGAQKRDDLKEDLDHTGRITFFNDSKGYGFIKDDKTQDSIFVHVNASNTPLKENDRVSFQTERGPKGMAAVNVKKI
jgi:cold shock CspA family protein